MWPVKTIYLYVLSINSYWIIDQFKELEYVAWKSSSHQYWTIIKQEGKYVARDTVYQIVNLSRD